VPLPGDPHVPANRRLFLAGLVDWVGVAPPDAESIAGAVLLDNGMAHVKTIQETGGQILGVRSLDLDGVTGLLRVSHRSGGTVYVYEGAVRLRVATREEAATLPVLATWGYRSIVHKAERAFIANDTDQ